MPKLKLNERLSNNEIYNRLKKELKHPKVTEIRKEDDGSIIINTSWMKYKVVVQDNQLNIKPRWNSGKFPLILVLVASGLILLVPLIVVAIISLSTMGEKREITTDITKIVNEPVAKAVNYSVDLTS